jgi:LPXTG-motif cell wall-anchored protein
MADADAEVSVRRMVEATVVVATALVMLISAAPVGAEEGSEGADAAATEAAAPSEEQATDSTAPAETAQTADPPEAPDDSAASSAPDSGPETTAPAAEAQQSDDAAPDSTVAQSTSSSTQPQATAPQATDQPASSTTAGSTPAGSTPAGSTPAGSTPAASAAPAAQSAASYTEVGEQTATITGTAIAVATSGGNVNIATGSQSDDGDDQPAILGTGDASARGSLDQTGVVQEATAVLSGGATADITQVVLVFNIGAALANSGLNVIGGAGSNGSQISTGSATAIGNDAASYMTQAATADASSNTSDTASQLAVNLRIGVAVADSGNNVVVVEGPGGSVGGVIDTGAANATGNQSLTEIVQRAFATGSGAAHLTIEQRATVINLGLAIANSGINTVRGLAGSLINAPDEFIARELFALILPALLASVSAGDGTGAGGTILAGDATAIGNSSKTYIDQNAVATASGDGTASISQDVIVANVGAAVANTGANQLGSGAAEPAALDAEGMRIATELGQFLTGLLEEIERWNMVPGAAPLNLALQLPFGDLVIGLDASIGGSSETISDATSSAHARIRQVTAIISIGISRANSGFNATSLQAGTLAAVSAVATASGASSITTGDATATNMNLVIVCQKDDAEGYECLRPADTVDPVDPAGPVDPVDPIQTASGGGTQSRPAAFASAGRTPAGATSASRPLPATGADVELLLIVGGALVVVGGLLTRLRRRAEA